MRASRLLGLVPLIGLLVVWQAVVAAGVYPTVLLPSPEKVVAAFQQWGPVIAGNALASVVRVVIGVGLAFVVAVPAGLLIGRYQLLDRLMDWSIQAFRSVPPISLIPLAMLFFGIGDTPAIVLIFLSALWPLLLNTIFGVRGIEATLLKVAVAARAGEGLILRDIVFPAALPAILTGLRLAIGGGWLTVVTAEMIAVKSGLGYMILNAQMTFRTELIFAGIFVIGAIGLLADQAVRLLRAKLCRWQEGWFRDEVVVTRVLFLLLVLAVPARGEVGSITFARQIGIAYLPFLIMQEDHLIEKHAALLGHPGLVVSWTVLTSGAAANDGLLSGQLAFGVGAVPAMLVLWDRTHAGSNAIRGVTGVAVMPTVLNTRNPAIHTIQDFSAKDRIALPAVKVSNHAIVLEMAAAAAFGAENWGRLDPLTVALPHPDAAAQLMGRAAGQIETHFASPPHDVFELRSPQVHTVLSSVDVMGDASLTLLWTTERFAAANPMVVQAAYDAVQDALGTINADKEAAADRYLRLSGDKIAREDLMTVLENPHIRFSSTPLGTMAFARFMKQTGALRTVPGEWTDLFFPSAQTLPGN